MIDIYELLRRDQNGTSDYVISKLDELGISWQKDEYGNIYNLSNDNAPLLSAHMDTVRKDIDFCIGAFLANNDSEEKIFSGGILGGDDKCGVYLILKVLEAGKQVNFVFSRDEEIGCLGIKAFVEGNGIQDRIKQCSYCLVLDRRGNSDIICKNNSYGTEEFEKALSKVSDDFGYGYKPATGLCSDANTISEYVSTVNLSTGYWSPHSDNEYIVKKDLNKCFEYVISIIDNIKEHFDAPEKYSWGSYYNKYNGSCRTGYYNYWDYDDDIAGYYRDVYDTYPREEDDPTHNDGHCDFCKIVGYTSNEKTYKIMMPDGSYMNICEFCFEDLEEEVKAVRKKIDADNIKSAVI